MNTKNLFLFWRRKTNTPFNPKNTDSLEKRIGYSFKNTQLKTQALTHKSYANENGHDQHNERLEFLGDAVFDLCVSDLLMTEYPTADEGDLSKMRASLVNTIDLSELALRLQLNQDMKLGMSEMRDKGRLKPRLLACTLEAIIGAIYLDGGYQKARQIVKMIMGQKIKEGPVNRDYKSILQEFIQKKFQKVPIYHTVSVSGRQHEKIFAMKVCVENDFMGEGKGRSKKEATQAAALSALKKLGVSPYTQM